MARGFTPQHFVRLFTAGIADRQVVQYFTETFGPVCGTRGMDNTAKASYT